MSTDPRLGPGGPGGEVRAFGDAALLRRVEGPAQARALAASVRRSAWPEVLDVVAGLDSVLLLVDPEATSPDDLVPAFAALGAAPPASQPEPATVVLPTAFDGPDLEVVAAAAGTSPAEVVGLLAAASLEVAVLGFSPGFAYLAGLPGPLAAVPRRASPRPAVPAGSVALAAGWAGVYPQATPGGWQVVGTTAVRLFDPLRPPFALLAPGDRVRLAPVDGPLSVGAAPRSAWKAPATPALTVLDPGPLALVQDGGRPGAAHLGVPGAGPADPEAAVLANRLVGLADRAPCVEVTMGPAVLRAERPLHVAVVGGGPGLRLDGLEVAPGRVLPVAPGQRLALGPCRAGARSYLSVAGGLVAPSVLGSCATDTLSWTGPGRLAVGDVVGWAGQAGPLGGHLAPAGPAPATRVLRVVAGPHAEWFDPDALERLGHRRFLVQGASDRVGLRLVPEEGPGVSRRPEELPSGGMVTGAVQIPPDGHPVVLGPDHATLGGYPVLAVVVTADLGVAGQCRPGERVQLVPVSPHEARAALAERAHRLGAAVRGRYPVVPG